MIRTFCTFMQGGMNLWYSSTLERFGQTQRDHKSRVGKNYSQKNMCQLDYLIFK